MPFRSLNFGNPETILQGFDRIADKIARDIQIKIDDARHKIVDFALGKSLCV